MGATRTRAMVPADLACLRDLVGAHPELAGNPTDPTAAWARAAQEGWGLCGAALTEDDIVTAAVLVCPGLHLPSGHPMGQWARVPGAAHLVALAVSDPEQGARATRMLVQGLARRLHGQVATVEAAAHPTGDALAPPVDWLRAAGFTECDEHRVNGFERVRLDIGAGVQWRDDLNRAWDLLAGLVPRPVRPEPGGARQTRCRRSRG